MPILGVSSDFSVRVGSPVIAGHFFGWCLWGIKQKYPTVYSAVLDLAPRGGAIIVVINEGKSLC